MIFKVFGVVQVILIQIISAQLSTRDLASQNVLNHFANRPLAGYGRSRRQINNPPVGESASEDLSVNGIANSLPLRNGMPVGNLPLGGGLLNNFGLPNLAFNNGLPTSFTFNNGLPNSPFNLPFPSANIAPQNRMIPNLNGLYNNGLPINIPKGLPSLNNVPNGLPSLNNVPNGLPTLNIMPNGLPGLNIVPNVLSGLNNVPNGLPGLNIVPNELSGLNNVPNGLPSLNNVPNGLPSLNNVPSGLPNLNNVPNGLPSLNNVPNGLPSLINVPNALPSLSNVPKGFSAFNNVPNTLPGLNNVPNSLPSFNNIPNGLPSLNNVPNELPSLNNFPNGFPGFHNIPNTLPGLNNVPNGLPSFNNVPNRLPNINNLLVPNTVLNLNNVPVGQNILNLNNLAAGNSLSIMNSPISNGLPSFNNVPCGKAVPRFPLSNGLPLNNLSSGNQLPFLNNFRITEIGIGNGIADIKRLPRNDLPDGYMLPNNLQSGNELAQQVADEMPNIYNYQNNNGFSAITNTCPARELSNRVSSINNFSNGYDVRNFAVETIGNGVNIANIAQNINNMELNNNLPDVSNFKNYNAMPVIEQRFANNDFNNGFADANNFPANTAMPNANSRLVNAINNGMPLSHGGQLNDILFADNGMAVNMPKTCVLNTDGNGCSSNDFQFANAERLVNNWHYDIEGTNMPVNQNILPEGVQMFSNGPSDHQSVLVSNNLNLAQELIKNLRIEGNMPFLNGLPIAGITETVTVLNGPYGK